MSEKTKAQLLQEIRAVVKEELENDYDFGRAPQHEVDAKETLLFRFQELLFLLDKRGMSWTSFWHFTMQNLPNNADRLQPLPAQLED